MKDEKSLGWLYNTKHLNIGLPSSTTGGTSALVSFAIIALLILNCWWFLLLPHQPDLLIPDSHTHNDSSIHVTLNHTENSSTPSGLCDVLRGKWVPDTSPPLYTNDTCRYIQPSQNCLQNGRPDRGYLNWRWKPSDCELPPFNAAFFLDLMRGKKIAFIGGRSTQSLLRSKRQGIQMAFFVIQLHIDKLMVSFSGELHG